MPFDDSSDTSSRLSMMMPSKSDETLMRTIVALVLALLGALILPVPAEEVTTTPELVSLASPAASVSFVPQLRRLQNGDVAASWLEETPNKIYSFRLSLLHSGKWGPVRTIAKGAEISHFSADLPGVMQGPYGVLIAFWEVSDHTTGDRYATTIQLSSSKDGGASWSKPVRPYMDLVHGQHSFLSALLWNSNLEFMWLDAQMQTHMGPDHASMGAIGLRNIELDREMRIKNDRWVTPIACECCPTAAAITADGPVVVFRGRAEPTGAKAQDVDPTRATVRDIQISRLKNGRWTAPQPVHQDNWIINGCPDNGPAIDAEGRDVVVAWWTAAHNQPSVFVAFSSDAGAHFGPPIRVDRTRGEGQVTVAWNAAAKEAVIGWLEDHQTWARLVSQDGRAGQPLSLGPSPSHARLPSWIAGPQGILVGWTGLDGDRRAVKFGYLNDAGR